MNCLRKRSLPAGGAPLPEMKTAAEMSAACLRKDHKQVCETAVCLKETEIMDEKKRTGKRSLRGSFTVEACVIFPLLFFLIAFALRVAIEQYGEVKELSQTESVLEEVEPAETMWNMNTILKEIRDED